VVCIPAIVNRLGARKLSALPRRLARRLGGAAAKQGWAVNAIRRQPP